MLSMRGVNKILNSRTAAFYLCFFELIIRFYPSRLVKLHWLKFFKIENQHYSVYKLFDLFNFTLDYARTLANLLYKKMKKIKLSAQIQGASTNSTILSYINADKLYDPFSNRHCKKIFLLTILLPNCCCENVKKKTWFNISFCFLNNFH
jgi:hypothetical protein